MSGLGFNGYKDGKPVFRRCRNVDIMGTEFAPNMRGFLDHWNMNTTRYVSTFSFVNFDVPT